MRPLAVIQTLVACGLLVALAAPHAQAQRSGSVAVTCANLTSGATWQIKIDYDRRTVDSNPARITEAEIKWRDESDGGNYTLDRKTGNLTVVVASSTGGYFIYDRCKLEN